ncbi:MAG: ketopantoate reductase family protein [Candidatus Omnitrophica bacterium]|nr:ketopantoate reductase family protein [Candidatus Omnitrophota bacterium]
MIAVIGAGAIGCLVAGYLKQKDEDVVLIGRSDTVEAVKKEGLKIYGVRGDFDIAITAYQRLFAKPQLVILATKTQDIEEALKTNLDFIQDSLLITTQNGVQVDKIVAKFLPEKNILSSIVMFGATYLAPAKIMHNFEGSWILGKPFGGVLDDKALKVSLMLDKAFPVVISKDIKGMKYLKVFVNANNCIPAILGVSMQEAFSDPQISRISIAIWKEGFDVISKAGVKLTSLPGFPVENITKLISLPSLEAAKIFSGMMTKLSKDPLYGSILQSIKRGRVSEIDYINGEFVNLAKNNKLSVPLNAKLVRMVHEVEERKKFFTPEELLNHVKLFLN